MKSSNKNRWFPGDRKSPEFRPGWTEVDLDSDPAFLLSLSLSFDDRCTVEMVVELEDESKVLLRFEDAGDVNFDGSLSIGLSATGIEIDFVAQVVGSKDKTPEGRTVYCIYLLDAVLTFSSCSVSRSVLDK